MQFWVSFNFRWIGTVLRYDCPSTAHSEGCRPWSPWVIFLQVVFWIHPEVSCGETWGSQISQSFRGGGSISLRHSQQPLGRVLNLALAIGIKPEELQRAAGKIVALTDSAVGAGVDEWMDSWVNGGINGWMTEWVDRWTDGFFLKKKEPCILRYKGKMLKLKAKENLFKLLISQILLARNTLRPIMRLFSVLLSGYYYCIIGLALANVLWRLCLKGYFLGLLFRSQEGKDKHVLHPWHSSSGLTRYRCP